MPIFADRLNHACLNDGALLSRAEFVRYPAWRHGGACASSRGVEGETEGDRDRRRVQHGRRYRAVAGAAGARGGVRRLARRRRRAWLRRAGRRRRAGRGTLAHFGLESDRIVYMGTLGKAAGVAGAFVAAHPAVIETLVQTARSYIFTTAAPPLLAEALRASLRIIARRSRPARASLRPARPFPRAHARPALALCANRGRRFSRSWSAPMRRQSSSPARSGTAASGCPRSARRRCRSVRRGFASRSRRRTRATTSTRSRTRSRILLPGPIGLTAMSAAGPPKALAPLGERRAAPIGGSLQAHRCTSKRRGRVLRSCCCTAGRCIRKCGVRSCRGSPKIPGACRRSAGARP